MKQMNQLFIIVLISLVGEMLSYFLPLPIPANIYGMILLLILLCSNKLKVEQIEKVGTFLQETMPLMFIPAGVKVLTVWEKVPIGKVFVIIVISTIVVMAITGRVAQIFTKKESFVEEKKLAVRKEKINWKIQLVLLGVIIGYFVLYFQTRWIDFNMTFLEKSAFFGLVLTLLTYFIGVKVKEYAKLEFYNPLLIAIIVTIAILKFFNIEYNTYASSAQIVSYFLTPATIVLALSLYKQRKLIKEQAKAIICGIIAGVIGNGVAVWGLCKLFSIEELVTTLLPKSVTTAVGMTLSEQLGGMVEITVATIITTGVVGASLGTMVCKWLKITDPIAKGLAFGTSAHAVGTSRATKLGEKEGAMSSLAIGVTALLTSILVTIMMTL